MAKTASLTAGLVAKKGEAAPAVIARAVPAAVPAAVVAEPEAKKPVAAAGADYYKSLTVKLDRQRYEALKNAGVKLDKKSQEIFVEALDLWLKSNAASQA